MYTIQQFSETYLSKLHFPSIRVTDILEILIISFLVYQILVWIRNTKAWNLLRGVVVVGVFVIIAVALNMTTIIWLVKGVLYIGAVGLIVILQPELRKALEELGKKKFLPDIFRDSTESGLFSDNTIKEIVRATVEMSKVRTGALIIVKQNDSLQEFEKTGIKVDGIVTNQLLINIFEHNTPLHDGAVIIEGDRVSSATCYLPLTENASVDKKLGTRHRAGLGASEETDAMVIIVSEQTGKISVAYKGELSRNITAEDLESRLTMIQNKDSEEKQKKTWRGRGSRYGKKDN